MIWLLIYAAIGLAFGLDHYFFWRERDGHAGAAVGGLGLAVAWLPIFTHYLYRCVRRGHP